MRLSDNQLAFIQHYGSVKQQTLALDDYNTQYLKNYLDKLQYNTYLAQHLLNCAPELSKGAKVIDLGGGIGFNSAYFAYMGHDVIYLDIDPVSADAAKRVNDQLGFTDIQYKTGRLQDIATELQGALLCSRDVIEHVYDLEAFFKLSSKAAINVHNTAAILYSIFREREFKAIHHRAEMLGPEKDVVKARDQRRPYDTIRREIIHALDPTLSDAEVRTLSRKTRGLIKEDIERYIKASVYPPLHERTLHSNTCDPLTGNWAERCLSLEDYHAYAKDIPLRVRYPKYNTFEANGAKKWALSVLNIFVNIPIHSLQPSFSLVY